MKEKRVFIYADGDDVGDNLKAFLLSENIVSAAKFSSGITAAIEDISNMLSGLADVDIIFAGGDELLASAPSHIISNEFINLMCSKFKHISGCTLSVGIGENPSGAAFSLWKAKLEGKNRTVVEHSFLEKNVVVSE